MGPPTYKLHLTQSPWQNFNQAIVSLSKSTMLKKLPWQKITLLQQQTFIGLGLALARGLDLF
jgi:hypothetical protein